MSTLLVRGGVLWSAGERIPGNAVGVRDGRIVALGDEADVRALLGRCDDELDAAGGLVTSGFVDAHLHLGIAALDAMRCDLAGAPTWDEIAARVRAFASASDAEWIVGGGWDPLLFPPGGPTTAQLDELVPDRPAFLLNADHHGAWVNSRALALAGVDADTPEPADGRIERLGDGAPSGMLHEGAAQLVARILPAPDPDELASELVRASAVLHAAGITGWQEAALGEFGGAPDVTEAYRRTLATGRLVGRPTGAIWAPRDLTEDGIDAFVQSCEARREANARAGFATATVKLMQDGVIETRTAALLEPYRDGGEGLRYFRPELLSRLVPALNAAGFAVHVHALGDRAARDALDAIAAVPPADRARVRNHIAHLQLVDPTDVPRFARLGVTANLQPYWACETPLLREQTLPALGAERTARTYVFADLMRSGAALAMGSDWPVSSLDPWQGISVAVTRRFPGHAADAPLGPEQALPLAVALDAYTRGSADLLGLDGGGMLREGAPADLAVADRDPFAGPVRELAHTANAATVIGGEVVYAGR